MKSYLKKELVVCVFVYACVSSWFLLGQKGILFKIHIKSLTEKKIIYIYRVCRDLNINNSSHIVLKLSGLFHISYAFACKCMCMCVSV